MEIDEIVDYATKSPENTNPAVLRGMLSQLSGNSSGGVFVVTFTGNDPIDLTADKTLQEILQASASQIIMGRLVMHNTTELALGTIYTIPDMENGAEFIFWNLDGEVGSAFRLLLDESGTVTVGEWSWPITAE